MWRSVLSDNGRASWWWMIRNLDRSVYLPRVLTRRRRQRFAAAALAVSRPVARDQLPRRAAVPRRQLGDTFAAPTMRDIWAESARWQAFINSGQLAVAEWLPPGTQTSLAMSRFREAMIA